MIPEGNPKFCGAKIKPKWGDADRNVVPVKKQAIRCAEAPQVPRRNHPSRGWIEKAVPAQQPPDFSH
jgi:hypothetical protein